MLRHNDLDRAIDAAAGAIIRREPSRSLGAAVMARVRQGEAPAPRRFVWATAAASIALCAAIGAALITRVPALPLPDAARVQAGQPPVAPRVPNAMFADVASTRSVIRAPQPANRVATRAPLPQSDVSPIDPISTEPIVLSSIDVPQLERETTAVDPLAIEPLTIEPLATSND